MVSPTGLYFAGKKEVAEFYRDNLASWHKAGSDAVNNSGISNAEALH
jgi:hypothetical protein